LILHANVYRKAARILATTAAGQSGVERPHFAQHFPSRDSAMITLLRTFLFSLCLATPALAGPLDSISNADASQGLKEALTKGAEAAVKQLGANGGFLDNDKVKIPLPPAMQKAERALKMMGMQKKADELVTAMNRAAEAAVPEAKALLIDAVRQMSVADAKNILTGGDDSVTLYFRSKTEAPLTQKFLPIVSKATANVGLAEKYNSIAAQGKSLGLVKDQDANVEAYVTRKALDGLYLMIAEQEKALRANPLGAGSDLLKKVFGALK
jgi:hypothetical protein